jgi:hypothetical protein
MLSTSSWISLCAHCGLNLLQLFALRLCQVGGVNDTNLVVTVSSRGFSLSV